MELYCVLANAGMELHHRINSKGLIHYKYIVDRDLPSNNKP